MEFFRRVFLLLALWLIPMSYSFACLPDAGAAASGRTEQLSNHPAKPGRGRLFQQFRVLKAAKKQFYGQPGQYHEKASNLSVSALIIFIASIALFIVLGSLSLFWPFSFWLFLAGFLSSNILSVIILAKEYKGRSRKIARTILIISAILTGFFLVGIVALSHLQFNLKF